MVSWVWDRPFMALARKVKSCVATGLPERKQLIPKWLGLLCTKLNKKIKKMKQERTTLQMGKKKLICSTAFQDLSRGYASLLERYLYEEPHPALKRWNFHNPVINKQYPPIISEDYPAIVSHKWNANSYTRSEWLKCTARTPGRATE